MFDPAKIGQMQRLPVGIDQGEIEAFGPGESVRASPSLLRVACGRMAIYTWPHSAPNTKRVGRGRILSRITMCHLRVEDQI
jgi:hypothetical protein